jgi:ATP-dependent helicase/nuclease subunit B
LYYPEAQEKEKTEGRIMSLEFIAGSSGAGKSYQVYREIIEASMKEPDRQYLVIVPEQFTMQTQKEILRMHPKKGLMNIDVLSFNRLAWRVFSKVGGNTLPVLEETGKSLVVQRVIAEHRGELKVMERALSRQGAVSQMKSLISELLQYRVEPEDLDAWISSGEKAGRRRLSLKLEDVRTIYTAFREYLNDNYLTTEEVPQRLCQVIGESDLVKDAVIVLDGFTGFTPVQHQVVRELLMLAKKVYVILTAGSAEELEKGKHVHRLFHMSREMYRKVLLLAGEVRCEVSPVRWIAPGEHGRFAESPALAYLEQNLFRSRKKKNYEAAQSEIVLWQAKDPEQEVRMIAEQILRMVRREGYRYRDFAVVSGDLATYGRLAENIFAECGIPCFIDRKKAVMTNPLVEFVRAAIDMVVQNYSYDSVFRFLRTGLCELSVEETDRMENYCRALGIRGRKKYAEAWTRSAKFMQKDELLLYDEIRQKFADETAEFHEEMHRRNATARSRSEAVWHLLSGHGMQKKMEALRQEYEAAGDLAAAREYAQIYEAVLNLLDKIVEVLGDEPMKLADYQSILDAGFEETAIGLVPPGEDQVMTGDIERTRLKKIRVLFFAGVNEGLIPKPVAARGILSELDRQILAGENVTLAPTSREQMYQQRFYLYLAMTKASDRLVLSCSRVGTDGRALLPSYLMGVVKRMYDGLEIRSDEEIYREDPTLLLETPGGRMQVLLRGLQKIPDELPGAAFNELLRGMGQTEEGRLVVQKLLEAGRAGNSSGGIGLQMARMLYGDSLQVSITRLEDFAGCSFRHFLDYGLCLKEREEYAFGAADYGNVLHKALENYAKLLAKKGIRWGTMGDSQRNRIADEALEMVVFDYGNTILQSTKRNMHMIERIREILHRTVWALEEQISRGNFEPQDFEFRFQTREDLRTVCFRLEDGTQMKLRGTVDRIDDCRADGKHYVKIVDYKTGSTTLDLNRLYHGLQLQLTVYLNAVMESRAKEDEGTEVLPAGIFYYHIDDPLIEPTAEDLRLSEILKKLRPDGLVSADMDVMKLLDHTMAPGVRSEVIPVGMLKKPGKTGSIWAAGSQVAEPDEFETIRKFADAKVKELGAQIIRGDAKVQPALLEDKSSRISACEYCPYKSVCGFDERIPGYTYREIAKMTPDEALRAMREELNAKGED